MKITKEIIKREVITTVEEEAINIQMTREEFKFLKAIWGAMSVRDIREYGQPRGYTETKCDELNEKFWTAIDKTI